MNLIYCIEVSRLAFRNGVSGDLRKCLKSELTLD